MEKVYALNTIVSDPEKQVGNINPDSLPSLPVGLVKEIGQTQVVIAIDSAYFLPDGAYFSAYVALDFPGADQKLAFAAKDIKFNPKGIIGGEQSRLQLVSEHLIELGPHTQLLLPSDGSNYVNWSCNGFESVNLHGFFLFKEGIIRPPDGSADSVVTAEFQVNVTDMHNLMTAVTFSPFVVKGMEDFSFTVSQAYVDMSDFANPANVVLPTCYQQSYPDDINLWRGFYLSYFSVKLPEELSKQGNPVTLYANSLFIDDAGVTGNFGGTNLFTTNENHMNNEWGFSVDSLLVGLTLNKITTGRMAGEIVVPPLDNNKLEYGALISQNPSNGLVNYSFSISPSASMSISCFNSTLQVYESSSFSVGRVNRKFMPKLELNGKWTLDNTNWKFSGISFEKFTLITQAPYVTNGYFALISNDAPQGNTGNFPVSLSNIGFGIINSQPVLGATVGLNFGDTDQSGFSASTTVKIYTNISRNTQTNRTQWQYDHFALSTINLEVMTSVIELTGQINFNDDHPVYGKGFYGGLNFKIPSIMENSMAMACAFGKVADYRYWMIDATLPTSLPIGTSTLITSITGGIAYHMVNTKSQSQLISSVSPTASSGPALATHYVPDGDAGLFFKAGVGFKNAVKEEAFNGDVLFTVSFNENGGLNNINFSGNVYSMAKVAERMTSSNYAMGTANINYDNQQKILNAQLNLNANFSDALTATIWSQFYFSPGLWYVHLGKPSNPCSVNLLNLATANAYFMIGQSLEPMPNPPPQVTAVFNTMNDQRNEESIATGDGIACGMKMDASFGGEVFITEEIYVYGNGSAGAGFDMTLYKYAPTTHCEGSTAPFGMNYWYLQGQLYAYAGIVAGVAKADHWDFKILEGNVALLLQGKLPKPSYVYGGVYLQAAFMGFIDVDMTFDFDFGTNCVLVNG
ncbi:MAG: hypothetical protein HYZ14_16935 [Bacteroidetes bacterium]|nr:hypothetical protein [Bacteroidota bacterium]